MKLSVLIPFRPSTEDRDRLFRWVERRYAALLPEAQLCIGSCPEGQPFNRSAAINNAALQAKHDLLLVADADTGFHRKWIEDAAAMIEAGTPWVIPYSYYYNIDQASTEHILTWDPSCFIPVGGFSWEQVIASAVSGLNVVPRAAFEKVGGFDERFIGWGYEDRVWELVLDVLWGKHERITDAYCLHLWHPVAEDSGFNNPQIQYNEQLYAEYFQLRNDPASLARAIV